MNRNYNNVFGLDENNQTEQIHPNVLYGFAYYKPNSDIGWRYYVGTFVYLFGVFRALNGMEEEELYVKTDYGDVYEATIMSAYTFMYLDEGFNPIKLISRAGVDAAIAASVGNGGMGQGLVLVDLSYPGKGNVPRMQFEH